MFLVLLGFFCWSLSTFCRRMWRQKSRSHLFLWKNCHLPHWEICTMIWWEVLWSWIFRWPTRNRRLLGAFLPGSISSGSGPGWSGTSTSRTSTTSANTTRTIRWWCCKCFFWTSFFLQVILWLERNDTTSQLSSQVEIKDVKTLINSSDNETILRQITRVVIKADLLRYEVFLNGFPFSVDLLSSVTRFRWFSSTEASTLTPTR